MRRGFTLVELLTVIAIIAILAAIIFPVAGTVRENARKSRCSSNLSQIFVALQAYKDDFRAYPPVLGAYAAVDWALASNLVPTQESGRYMAIWHIAMTMPQVIAPLIAGPLGDYWNAQYGLGAGWRWLFALAPIYFLASAFLLRPVREIPVQVAGRSAGMS